MMDAKEKGIILDLTMWYDDEGLRRMMAICAIGDEVWQSSDVPAEGAFGPISEEIYNEFPDQFDSVKDIRLDLCMIHAINMRNKKNRMGQDYLLY